MENHATNNLLSITEAGCKIRPLCRIDIRRSPDKFRTPEMASCPDERLSAVQPEATEFTLAEFHFTHKSEQPRSGASA